jgi:para-nitrobenzyl esterase
MTSATIAVLRRRLAVAALAALSFAAAGYSATAAPSNATARVEAGVLAGAVDNGVLSFKGVPFAAPPLGNLRWRAPQPAAHWQGVRSATAYGHDCMQKPFPSDAAPLGTPPNEDCLVLNVWRPVKEITAKLPVMVWIYGGGFVNGGSSPAVYDGSQFAKRNIVFVSFNYRLGRLGFFAFPALTKEQAGKPLGNYGFMDQIAALTWVKHNIAAFGGNPDNVTVFGESAGGFSVNMLLTSPVGRGLFNKAIIESGGGRNNLSPRRVGEDLPNVPSGEHVGINFAKSMGIAGTDAEALAALRALPASKIGDLDIMDMLQQTGEGATYAGPMRDGQIVIGEPEQVYLAGQAVKVPVMIGANSADLGFPSGKTMDELTAPFGPRQADALAAYDPDKTGDVGTVGVRIASDQMMVEPARFVAATLAAQGVPTYEYRFSYVAASMRNQPWFKAGAPHASEIPFVFDTVAAKYGKELTAQDEAVAQAVNTYWANFAKTGEPQGAGLPRWPVYTATIDEIMDFTADGQPVLKKDPWRARLDLAAEAHLRLTGK